MVSMIMIIKQQRLKMAVQLFILDLVLYYLLETCLVTNCKFNKFNLKNTFASKILEKLENSIYTSEYRNDCNCNT